MVRVGWWVCSLVVVACAPDPASEGAPTDSGAPSEVALPDPWTEHYRVETLIEAGGYAFEERYWARRDLDPVAGTITERFVAEADGTETLTLLQVDADAGTFSLDINAGEYTGAGTLVGEPWDWTAWSSRAEASDGSYALSEDAVTETGIHTDKEGFSADGTPEWTLTEDLFLVDEETHDEALSALDR